MATRSAAIASMDAQAVKQTEANVTSASAVLLIGVLLAGFNAGGVDLVVLDERGIVDPRLPLQLASYALACSTLVIAGARLGTLYGYARIYLVGLGIFLIGSSACALATSVDGLLVARALQGSGAALLIPQMLSAAGFHCVGHARTRAVAYFVVGFAASVLAGWALGGRLAAVDLFHLGWRSLFLVDLVAGGALLLAARRALRSGLVGGAASRDFLSVTVLACITLFVAFPVATRRGVELPAWSLPTCLAVAIPLIAFVGFERRLADLDHHPLPIPVLRAQPALGWMAVSYATALSTYVALLSTFGLYLQAERRESARYAAVALAIWLAAGGLGSVAFGTLAVGSKARCAPCPYLVLAGSYCVIGACGCGWLTGDTTLFAALAVGGFAAGAGFESSTRRMCGVALPRLHDARSLATVARQLGSTAGIAVFGSAYLGCVLLARNGEARRAFAVVMAMFALTAGAAAIAANQAERRHRATFEAGD